jgi:hypothetical protein
MTHSSDLYLPVTDLQEILGVSRSIAEYFRRILPRDEAGNTCPSIDGGRCYESYDVLLGAITEQGHAALVVDRVYGWFVNRGALIQVKLKRPMDAGTDPYGMPVPPSCETVSVVYPDFSLMENLIATLTALPPDLQAEGNGNSPLPGGESVVQTLPTVCTSDTCSARDHLNRLARSWEQ